MDRPPPAPADRREGREPGLYFMGYWYPQAAVYDDVSGWVAEPCTGQGEFYMGHADYDVRITVPAGWPVAATGVLQNPGEMLSERRRPRHGPDLRHAPGGRAPQRLRARSAQAVPGGHGRGRDGSPDAPRRPLPRRVLLRAALRQGVAGAGRPARSSGGRRRSGKRTGSSVGAGRTDTPALGISSARSRTSPAGSWTGSGRAGSSRRGGWTRPSPRCGRGATPRRS